MLRELSPVRQHPNEYRRRWFSSNYFDLIVWLSEDEQIAGFQLCYDKQGKERALTWLDGRLSHAAVDSGDTPGLGAKTAPILVRDGKPDMALILSRFMRESGNLPAEISAIVERVLTPVGDAERN
ncbi:hypothetical protein [Chitinimonas sp.]|uniref:hypothetical protein n=1 Tax=Chitinimonas sp. TaxID=1934313 RepID=UPI0035AF34E4